MQDESLGNFVSEIRDHLDFIRETIARKKKRFDDEYAPVQARVDAEPAKYGKTHCSSCQQPCKKFSDVLCNKCYAYFYDLAMRIGP